MFFFSRYFPFSKALSLLTFEWNAQGNKNKNLTHLHQLLFYEDEGILVFKQGDRTVSS